MIAQLVNAQTPDELFLVSNTIQESAQSQVNSLGSLNIINLNKGKWNVQKSTDYDYFVWFENSSSKNTYSCLLSKTAVNPSQIPKHKNIYNSSGYLIETLNAQKLAKQVSGLNKDYYGWCRNLLAEQLKWLKFGENSTVVVYQEEKALSYNFDFGQTNFTLYKKINETYQIAPPDVFIKSDENTLKFGAIDNTMNRTEISSFTYLINSTGKLILIEQQVSNVTYPVFYNFNQTKTDETRQVYDFYDICKNNYSDCNWNLNGNSAIVRFNSKRFIDPSIVNINSCYTLNTAGDTYNMTSNVKSALGTCMVITANNVTLEGNNFNIVGDKADVPSAPPYSDIYTSYNCDSDIEYYDVDGSYVTYAEVYALPYKVVDGYIRVDYDGTSAYGWSDYSMSGCEGGATPWFTINWELPAIPSGADGWYLSKYDDWYTDYYYDTVAGTIYLDEGDSPWLGATVYPDYATGDGIYVNNYNNFTLKNVYIYNASNGIYLKSNNSKISNVTSNFNGDGVYLENANNNEFDNVITNNNLLYGVFNYNNGINNVFNNLLIKNNINRGLYSAGGSFIITNGTLINNSNYGIYSDGSCNLTNVQVTNHSYGIYLTSNNILNNITVIKGDNYCLSLNSNNLVNNFICINTLNYGITEVANNNLNNITMINALNGVNSNGDNNYLNNFNFTNVSTGYRVSNNPTSKNSTLKDGFIDAYTQGVLSLGNDASFNIINLSFNMRHTTTDLRYNNTIGVGARNNILKIIDSKIGKFYFVDTYDLIDVTIENSSAGKIHFSANGGLNRTNGTCLYGCDNALVKISNNSVYVNGSHAGMNKTANISLYNIPIFTNGTINNTVIGICNQATNPSCVNLTSLNNGGTVTFNVSSWNQGYFSIVDYITAVTNCWSKTNNVLFIPVGCIYQLNKGESYKI